MSGMRLYRRDLDRRVAVYGMARRFRYLGRVFADVPLTFFRAEYDAVRSDLDDWRTAMAEEEFFTEAEADALIAWLACDAGIVDLRKERLGPVQKACMPYGDNPAGGGCDFWRLYEEPAYDLPFKAEAWVDFEGCRTVDEPPPRFRPMFLPPYLGHTQEIIENWRGGAGEGRPSSEGQA